MSISVVWFSFPLARVVTTISMSISVTISVVSMMSTETLRTSVDIAVSTISMVGHSMAISGISFSQGTAGHGKNNLKIKTILVLHISDFVTEGGDGMKSGNFEEAIITFAIAKVATRDFVK